MTGRPGLHSFYLETILRFIGFTDICSIIVQPTLMGGPDVAKQKLDAGIEAARALAKEL